MKYYNGKQPDDPKPVGGGSWNKEHPGSERFNFKARSGRFYGFCQPSGMSNNINLKRIDPNCQENVLPGVLVVFVAVDPDRGRQRVVGWYGNARVYAVRQRSHKKGYFAMAAVRDSFLVPVEPYRRKWIVRAGLGGIGQANVCYLYGSDGLPKNLRWQKRILKKIENTKLRK